MYANQPAAKIDTYWNFLKNLSGTEKLQLITRLSSSLLDNTSVPTKTAANFYGVWKDDDFIEDSETMINNIKSSRHFKGNRQKITTGPNLSKE